MEGFDTEFRKKDGSDYAVDFGKLAGAYGAGHILATTPAEFRKALRDALSADSAVVVEAEVERRFPTSGTSAYGFWDIPSPYN